MAQILNSSAARQHPSTQPDYGGIFDTPRIQAHADAWSSSGSVALKVGLLFSIQGVCNYHLLGTSPYLCPAETHVLPPGLDCIFRPVHFGPPWRFSLTNFNPIPFAVPPIGQVHHAILAPPFSPTGRPERVTVNIQFPSIGKNVTSDLSSHTPNGGATAFTRTISRQGVGCTLRPVILHSEQVD